MKCGTGSGAHIVADVRLFEWWQAEADLLPEQKAGEQERPRDS
jgi:hypothetical protein